MIKVRCINIPSHVEHAPPTVLQEYYGWDEEKYINKDKIISAQKEKIEIYDTTKDMVNEKVTHVTTGIFFNRREEREVEYYPVKEINSLKVTFDNGKMMYVLNNINKIISE